MEEALSYAWVPKAIAYGLAQLAIGVALARALSSRRSAAASPAVPESEWFIRLARTIAFLLAATLAARLWVQTAAAFGPSEAFGVEPLRIIALESRWGEGWRLQAMATVALLASAWAIPAWRGGWVAFGACAVGVVVAMPLLGHASGSPPRYAVHAVHGLGAGVWVGTLGVMALASWRRPRAGAERQLAATIARSFSPIAIAAAALIAVSGAVVSWLYVGSWTALGTTLYGRVLLVKLLAVACVGLCGWANWREVRRDRSPKRALVTLEYMAAVLAIALTGMLTETEHP